MKQQQCSDKDKISYTILIVLLITISYLASIWTINDTYTIISNIKLDCKCNTEPRIEYTRQQENQGSNYTIHLTTTTIQKCTCIKS